jgi:multisubunit Na+/H+ antiporter MnhB subunit
MSTPLTLLVSRVVTAPLVIVAFATLVRGYQGVGDGFAAGLIAALAVLLQYPALGPTAARRLLPVGRARAAARNALVAAILLALVPLAFGDPLLTHAPEAGEEPAHVGSIELTTAFAFDVAICVLVVGVVVTIFDALAAVAQEREEEREREEAETA